MTAVSKLQVRRFTVDVSEVDGPMRIHDVATWSLVFVFEGSELKSFTHVDESAAVQHHLAKDTHALISSRPTGLRELKTEGFLPQIEFPQAQGPHGHSPRRHSLPPEAHCAVSHRGGAGRTTHTGLILYVILSVRRRYLRCAKRRLAVCKRRELPGPLTRYDDSSTSRLHPARSGLTPSHHR